MIILLNGPLGIGKSTLAEALTESIAHCVMLDGDHLVAVNPPAHDEREHLHATIELLVAHHLRFGYHHFIINHFWSAPEDLTDLRRRLLSVSPNTDIHCFLLTLPVEENLRRIRRRQRTRAIDERAFERKTVVEERDALFSGAGEGLGEPFDVSPPPSVLVAAMLHRLGLRRQHKSPGSDG